MLKDVTVCCKLHKTLDYVVRRNATWGQKKNAKLFWNANSDPDISIDKIH